jgi:hypothetical protein
MREAAERGTSMMRAAALPVRRVNSASRCPSRVLPARHDGVALCNLCARVNSGNAGARTTSQSNDGGNSVRGLHRRELHELLTRASRALLAPVPPSVSLVRTGATSWARALGVKRPARARDNRVADLAGEALTGATLDTTLGTTLSSRTACVWAAAGRWVTLHVALCAGEPRAQCARHVRAESSVAGASRP